MKRLISIAMLLIFGAAIVGCEAHGRVGDPDSSTVDSNGRTYSKKTTTVNEDGQKTVKTETRVNNP